MFHLKSTPDARKSIIKIADQSFVILISHRTTLIEKAAKGFYKIKLHRQHLTGKGLFM